LAVNVVAGEASSISGDGSGTGANGGGSGDSSGSSAMTIATDSRREVTANVAEGDIGSVRVGDLAELTVEAYPGESFVGTVTSLPLQASTGSGGTTYPVQVTVDGTAQELLPGMTAAVSIVTAQAANALLVPNDAVRTTASGKFVDALDRHNRVTRVPVRTGISDASYTQILAGLGPGQRILRLQPDAGIGAQ
jgi:multidrug efflux pump subunit AcrA (membrane-fusion protein)